MEKNRRQVKFKELLAKHNYKSANEFCTANGIQPGNFNKRLKYEDLKVDLTSLFLYANILHEPVEKLIEIFYPDEYSENHALIDKES